MIFVEFLIGTSDDDLDFRLYWTRIGIGIGRCGDFEFERRNGRLVWGTLVEISSERGGARGRYRETIRKNEFNNVKRRRYNFE